MIMLESRLRPARGAKATDIEVDEAENGTKTAYSLRRQLA
jgi:hypothetical protein